MDAGAKAAVEARAEATTKLLNIFEKYWFLWLVTESGGCRQSELAW
jgi:hypothetical protein